MTAADRQAAAARQRRHTIALWRWALTEPAMDPALTSRQRGAVVRDLASREHQDPDGRRVSVSRRTIDRWVVAWSPGNFVDISIMLLLVPNCQIGARNPLGLSCRADVVSGRDCNIARCSRTRRS